SDIPRFRAMGIFLGLFLIDRIMHMSEADIPVTEAPGSADADPLRAKILSVDTNVAHYLRDDAYHVLERAYDRSIIKKTDCGLEILNLLTSRRDIKEGLSRLDVNPKEFQAKLEELLRGNISPDAPSREFRESAAQRIGNIAMSAFRHAAT